MLKVIFFAAIAFIITAIMVQNDYEHIQFGEAKLVYDAATVDKGTAKKVHLYLLKKDAYKDKSGDILLIEKKQNGHWVVKFPVFTGAETNQTMLNDLEKTGLDMQKNIFNNKPVEIHITNSSFSTVQFFKL